MINNDVLRSVRYMLDFSDANIVEIIKLAQADSKIEKAHITAFLTKEDLAGYRDCSDEVLVNFLDGLVFFRRGKDETLPTRLPEVRISNNGVLKKLRVAFELKDADMHQILHTVGFPVSKPELNALFRQVGHRNYRDCGDQLLRNFLKGLTQQVRG